MRKNAVSYVGRYGGELLIVFVGVWLSLLAEDWRQSRVDASTEHSAMQRMIEDLDSDLADLRLNLARAEVGVTAGRQLLGHQWQELSREDLHRALSAIQFCSTFIETPAEYLALRNSGRLNVIRDTDLRRRVVALYESRIFLRAAHTTDCENNYELFDLMASHVNLAEPSEPTGQFGESHDDLPDASQPRVVGISDLEGLYENNLFRSSLTQLVAYRNFLASRIRVAIDGAENLQAELLARSAGS